MLPKIVAAAFLAFTRPLGRFTPQFAGAESAFFYRAADCRGSDVYGSASAGLASGHRCETRRRAADTRLRAQLQLSPAAAAAVATRHVGESSCQVSSSFLPLMDIKAGLLSRTFNLGAGFHRYIRLKVRLMPPPPQESQTRGYLIVPHTPPSC